MRDRTSTGPTDQPFWRPYLAALLGALVLITPTVINRSPLYFIDTQSYVRMAAVPVDAVFGSHIARNWRKAGSGPVLQGSQAADAAHEAGKLTNRGVTANRSVYYGALVLLSYVVSNFWLLIVLQAVLSALTIAIPWWRVYHGSTAGYSILVTAAALGTPLALFVGFVMPDIFAGLLILSAATLLAGWSKLYRTDRWVLLAVGALAVLVHNSHVVIVLGILTLAAIVPHFRRHIDRTSIIAVGALLPLAFAGQLAFGMALRHTTGSSPLLLPHISAHLVDRGPGTKWLKENCGKVDLALCQFKDRLPTYWEDFLGSGDPGKGVFAAADLPTKQRLSHEQAKFALAVFRDEPLAFSSFFALEAGRQLVSFSMNGFVAPDQLAFVAHNWPADLSEASEQSLFARHPEIVRAWSTIVYTVTVLSFLLGLFLLFLDRPAVGPARVLAELILIGVVTNALVCGILASPYDRFQARVVWLIFITSILLVRSYRLGRIKSVSTRLVSTAEVAGANS